jgi:hypothetical protein
VRRVDRGQGRVEQERQPDEVRGVVGTDRAVGRDPVVRLEPAAGLEDVPGEVLEQVEHPHRLLGRRERGGQPEGHLEPVPAALAAGALLVVVERRIAVSAEVQVGRAPVPALVGADPVEGVRPAEHVLDDRAPVPRLLVAVQLAEAGVDRVPSWRGIVAAAVAALILGEHCLPLPRHRVRSPSPNSKPGRRARPGFLLRATGPATCPPRYARCVPRQPSHPLVPT